MSFRAVCRVLSLLASALGIKRAPCVQTVINWVIRLSIVQQFPPMAPMSYVTMMSEQSTGDLTSIWL